MKILAHDTKKNKTVLAGNLIGDTFFKEVTSKHYMRRIDGYGISEDAFQKILENKCRYVIIRTTTDDWKASAQDWVEHGHVADYGSGKQRFLSLKYMTRKKAEFQFIGNTSIRL